MLKFSKSPNFTQKLHGGFLGQTLFIFKITLNDTLKYYIMFHYTIPKLKIDHVGFIISKEKITFLKLKPIKNSYIHYLSSLKTNPKYFPK